jgi:hypothetical protein
MPQGPDLAAFQMGHSLKSKKKLARCCGILWLCCLTTTQLDAQSGTAVNGYYPPNYNGAVFTGALESTAGDARQVTLVYVKGTETQRFVGRVESICGWRDRNGTAHTSEISEVPN